MAVSFEVDLAEMELAVGEHSFRVKMRDGTGEYSDSPFSNSVSYAKLFPVQVSVSHAQCSAVNPESIGNNSSQTVKFVFTPDAGYKFTDQSVTVTGAVVSTWNKSLGELYLNYATGNVSISVSAEEIPPQLSSPVISLSNSSLSWNVVIGAIKYNLYVNNQYKGYIDTDGIWHADT